MENRFEPRAFLVVLAKPTVVPGRKVSPVVAPDAKDEKPYCVWRI